MIQALLAILAAQLAGEATSRALSLPIPGPVLGMIIMVAALRLIPGFAAMIRPIASGILGHMSLLFVPAGVGVVGHVTSLGAQGPAIFAALVISTALAMTVGALVFAAVARWTGNLDE